MTDSESSESGRPAGRQTPRDLAGLMTVGPGSVPDGAAGDIGPGGGTVRVPGYRLVRELRGGGQAVVYQAVQLSTGRKAAIKLLREGPLSGRHERARFEREVHVLAALDHPNVVAILDRGTTPQGWLYLVMEYIDGLPLDEYLGFGRHSHTPVPPPGTAPATRGADGTGGAGTGGTGGDAQASPASATTVAAGLPLEARLRLFHKVAGAVNAAHLRGVVHRDLKPSNILVDDAGEPRVVDFGLARTGLGSMTGTASPEPVTVTGQFVGSLPWASPEQAEGSAGKVDLRSDVYSLGVLLYQMLTGGSFPYKVTGSMLEVMQSIRSAPVTPPSRQLGGPAAAAAGRAAKASRRGIRRRAAEAGLSPALEAVVLKALAKRRDDRYQSAGELARAVGECLAATAPPAAAPAGAARGRRLSAGLAATLLLACAATAGLWVGTRARGPRDPSRPPAGRPDSSALALPPASTLPGAVKPMAATSAKPGRRAPGRPLEFTPVTLATPGRQPVAVAAADFDGDGVPDLAVLTAPGEISLFLGKGDGTFSAERRIPLPLAPGADEQYPCHLSTGDADGDGRPDLVVTSTLHGGVWVLLNRGNGRFVPADRIDAPAYCTEASLADLEGDGKMSLVIKSELVGVSIRPAVGGGRFGPSRELPLRTYTSTLALLDADGGGKLDFAGGGSTRDAEYRQVALWVRLHAGERVIELAGAEPAQFLAAAVADLNHDGRADLLASYANPTCINVWLGNRGEESRDRPLVRLPASYETDGEATALRCGDFDGDGETDLAYRLRPGDVYRPGRVVVMRGRGDGSLGAPIVIRAGGAARIAPDAPEHIRTVNFPAGLAVADFDRDGRDDLAVIDENLESVTVLLASDPGRPPVVPAPPPPPAPTPGPTFAPIVGYPACRDPNRMVLADFDGDGKLDLAVPDGEAKEDAEPKVFVLPGRGDGTFEPSVGHRVPGIRHADRVTSADFNGDGRADLVVADGQTDHGAGRIALLSGRARGGASPGGRSPLADAAPLTVPAGVKTVLAPDFDGDGRPDLIVPAFEDRSVNFFRSHGDGTFDPPERVEANGAWGAWVADWAGDGAPSVMIMGAGSYLLRPGKGDGKRWSPPLGLHGGDPGLELPLNVTPTDLTGGGRPDLLTFDRGKQRVAVWPNDGRGGFGPLRWEARLPGPCDDVAVADLNGDGIPDLAVVDGKFGKAGVFLGRGDGTFAGPFWFDLGDTAAGFIGPDTVAHLAVRDLNGDGRPDIVTSIGHSGKVGVLLNTTTPWPTSRPASRTVTRATTGATAPAGR